MYRNIFYLYILIKNKIQGYLLDFFVSLSHSRIVPGVYLFRWQINKSFIVLKLVPLILARFRFYSFNFLSFDIRESRTIEINSILFINFQERRVRVCGCVESLFLVCWHRTGVVVVVEHQSRAEQRGCAFNFHSAQVSFRVYY